MAKKLELSQLVLCTVTRIVGTTVFVKIEDYDIEGSITFMEIAPGRIRNIREYAFPGKKIVCKVLEIKPNHIELSFRRVKVNERNEFNNLCKREKSFSAMFKTILGVQKAEEIIKEIKDRENSLANFLESIKDKPEILEEYLSKENSQKIISILKEKKIKEITLSKKFSLSSKASTGIILIKNLISSASKESGMEDNNSEISYIAAGKYMVKVKAKELKQADNKIKKMLEILEKLAKKNSIIFNEEK